ncbi:hypothetical protein [Desulforegula conservatrix]|uniref:hypothetical protein n=1 Tax=Desulforegula conservatrix TaxID=153026 RepID=UPI0003FC29AF|nr:hypothetical protein [Desulforegula conservatrix]
MNSGSKAFFLVIMTIALFCGFLPQFMTVQIPYNFERLHVFLFNLCSGGSIILYYTIGKKRITAPVVFFIIISIIYAFFAFFNLYIPAMVCSFILASIVASIRIRRFGFIPGFFKKDVSVSEKFHQASMLCLSLGLVISTLVIINNEYLYLISMKKLVIDTFFLGFSFPLSLITMSLMFALIPEHLHIESHSLKEAGFWAINLGVIIFFLFILFEKMVAQLLISGMLFIAVIVIFFLYMRDGKAIQQKNFLTSGMFFLVMTAITGIAYIVLEFYPNRDPQIMKFLLKLHTFTSLYGWNLSGLSVIIRYNDFPIQLHSRRLIAFHWFTVLITAPIGAFSKEFAIAATISYAFILYRVFFSGPADHAISQKD